MKSEATIQKNTKVNNSTVRNTVFVILTLVSIHFWDLKYIPLPMINFQNIAVWLISAFACVMVFRNDNLRFKWPVVLLIIGLLANCYASYVNHGQGIKLSILSFLFYYFILLYFLFHYLKLEKRFVENTVIALGLIYSLLFIIQYKVFPYEIFSTWVKTATDEMQFEIIGHGFLMLSFFLVINRYMTSRKLIYAFLALGFFMVQFKCGFRTLVAAAAVSAVFLVLKLIRFNIKDIFLILLMGIMFAGLTQYKSINKIINNMVKKTEVESKEGKDYIRNVEREFFYTQYPKNLSYYIIGGGKPAGKENINSYDPNAIGMNYNIVWVDIGLLGFYIVVGGIATLAILWYALKVILSKLPREAAYLSAYFFYLLLTSFTNEEIYRDGIFTVQAIALYLADMALDERAKSVVTVIKSRKRTRAVTV